MNRTQEVEQELHVLHNQFEQLDLDSPEWDQCYAAQQALAWALNPHVAAAPSVMLGFRERNTLEAPAFDPLTADDAAKQEGG